MTDSYNLAFWLKLLTIQVNYVRKRFYSTGPDVFIPIIGLYCSLDGIANLKYKLLCFLTPNEKNFEEKGTSF